MSWIYLENFSISFLSVGLNGHVCCSGTPGDVARNNEYKTLFGEQASQILSVYEHKHDHEHSHEGEIKKN